MGILEIASIVLFVVFMITVFNAGEECAKHFYELGKKDMKRKMMEGAVEGYVNYYEDSGGILMAEAQVGCPYHNGDKVKIIIVKEGDE